MQRIRREEPTAAAKPRWNASQLVAFNLARARRKSAMTQQEAADAISRYSETEWTQATVATAESSVTGARIRQFSPSELLAFCFAFDVPVGWFFMPPTDDEAEALEMPKHPGGIGWDWVFRRTTPTESNIDVYLGHQGDWARRAESMSQRPPFHERFGNVLRGSQALNDEELQTYFLLGLLRRGLGGSSDLRRGTVWGEGQWFSEASGVLQRVDDTFAAIGGHGPSPRHFLRKKDGPTGKPYQIPWIRSGTWVVVWARLKWAGDRVLTLLARGIGMIVRKLASFADKTGSGPTAGTPPPDQGTPPRV